MAEIITLPTKRPSRDLEPLWRDALGEQLRRLRHDRRERLADTAERAGVSPQYLSEIERGLKEPSSEMIAAVAGALEVTLVELMTAVADELRARTTDRPAVGASAAVLVDLTSGVDDELRALGDDRSAVSLRTGLSLVA
jgi:transcriptional regulator with XRE-family HTH domain